jgi:PPOX class probable F420-dependent enzyme
MGILLKSLERKIRLRVILHIFKRLLPDTFHCSVAAQNSPNRWSITPLPGYLGLRCRGQRMTLIDKQQRYLSAARVGRLATADAEGHPHVVPCCFTLYDGDLVTPLDEKPKDADQRELRRVQDIRSNSYVSLVVDHYREDWSTLGWVQVRGTAHIVHPDEMSHTGAITALREKYAQYDCHRLEDLPFIHIAIGHVISWGTLFPDSYESG